MKKVKIKINNQEIICSSEQTIMQVAHDNGIELPNLCFHPDFSVKANCRICVVEIAGRKNLATSCSTKAEDGMEIRTDTERVKRSRNLNIELIFAEHIEKCPSCIWRVNCKLLELADKYKIEITKFSNRKAKREIYKFANAVEIDGTQCMDCRNCLEACNNLQKINYLKLRGKGINQEVVPVSEESGFSFMQKKADKVDCIYCGQCAVHCPVGAAQEQAHWQLVEKVLRDKSKVIVAQFAPSIRVSIGEEFGLEHGKIMPGQVVTALRQLGFNYVFDVNFGADITTMVEAEELLKKIKSGSCLPMLTSCCPAWVKYIEFYRPDLIPNLTTVRSPQMHIAGFIKTYWAEKMKIEPKKIVVVSVMPCTAKKFEAGRSELKIGGNLPVDYVITTRELAWLIKKNKIDFSKLKPAAADNPLCASSGAAAIYGATGGVMESALRTAEYLLMTAQDSVCVGVKDKNKLKLCNSRIEFKQVRGKHGIKQALVEMAGKKLRIAVVNGIGNIAPILKQLKDYDYIEVMACPDGCIGGGGQPIPTTAAIRKKRLEALYKIDAKSKIRRAHENKEAAEALKWIERKGRLKNQVLYTRYKKRK
ncbi:[FeFe] hydrogenase, group A [Patescibacteria group bacterium]|nr:[FeFe] hydrogenase, group A [Patescibacteria group bacterium]MBU1663192.1 [FeFe] hydrogenase, group A [Patescibacteria group bacterium]MBU1934312.1 [FeFe] hydrogenase, group A [Patescibacteria group bacterium]MBU2007883.1 [FeFe] hydrogenase, group A [Patescibacteria group bacterium]MBU2233772.1 [FeFe] hydrogenase, group A [Patescibacteria group bacterium]